MPRLLLIMTLLMAANMASFSQDDYLSSGEQDTGLVVIRTKDGDVFKGVYKKQDENYYYLGNSGSAEIRVSKSRVSSFAPVRKGDMITLFLRNGSEVRVKVEKVHADRIEVQSPSTGTIEVKYDDISTFESGTSTKGRKQPRTAPEDDAIYYKLSRRHFLTHNALPGEKRTILVRSTWLVQNSFEFSVADPLELRLNFFGIAPGFGFKSVFRITDNLMGGLNADVVFSPFFSEFFVVGYMHPMLTYGDRNNNITIGSAFGFFQEEFFENPALTIAGSVRIDKNFALISENFLIPLRYYGNTNEPVYMGIYSIGFRHTGTRSCFDLGFIIIPQIFRSFAFPIPVFSYSVLLSRA